jgi:AcrR family transcriptional regulator
MGAEPAFNDNQKFGENDNDHKLRPGRPRSMSARKAILTAARRLLAQMPMAELSIEAIAKKAGVGKTTIYRWWPSKAAIALEAFLEQPGIQHILPTTATAAEAVQKQLESLIRQLRGQNGRIIAGIVAEGQSSQDALDLLYEQFLKERVETLYKFIELGKISGEFNDALSTDIAVDMLMGPLFLRVLSGEHGIDNGFAESYPSQAVLALKK